VSGCVLLLMYASDYDVCFSFVSSPLLRWSYLYMEADINVDASEDA